MYNGSAPPMRCSTSLWSNKGRTEWDNKHSVNKQRGQQIINCLPCQSEGDTVEAEAFCETCNEFICTSCLKVHRKLTATKSHVIKLKDEMPKIHNIRTDPCSELCAVHKTEVIKFFCKDHDSVGCGECMVLDHKTCTVKLVSDVSDKYDTSQELEQIKKNLGILQYELSTHKDEISNDMKATDEMREKVIKEIKLFRQEINKYLDKSETDLLKKIDEMKTKQVSLLKHIQKECDTIETELRECEKKIYKPSDKINDVFVAAKISYEKIKACQMSTSRYDFEILNFVKSKEFETPITNKCPLGEFIVQKERRMRSHRKNSLITSNVQTRLSDSVTIKDYNDKNVCYITGMAVLSREELLLVDFNNCFVKILNVKENKITSTYATAYEPWDITCIDYVTFAVTLQSKGEILFIKTTNGISKSRCLKVRKNCRGIDYRDGVLAVSFDNPGTVQLLDMKGTIMREYDIKTHCSYPYYITLSNDSKCFIVSDGSFLGNTLFEFSDDGHLKAKISSDNMKTPRGLLMTDDGMVIVCCVDISDRLSIVIPKTREILPLAVKAVQNPRYVALSDDHSRIFIFDYSDEIIKVFDII